MSALWLAGGAAASDPTLVMIAGQGAVRGSLSDNIAVFKNIPYAAPPLGALRWRPPQAALAWAGERDGSRFGPACPQTWKGAVPGPESEDCLSLNVWTPGDHDAPKPVMVWIHGGAFKIGTGATDFTSGGAYAKRGIVVVSINYRLGWLGFFAHPALRGASGEAEGNYGIMDQIAALRWVQANIASFGGDPKRVTIVGESAGGISVDALMASPVAKGLFAGAIAQSGFGRETPVPIRGTGSSAERDGIAFAQSLGIDGDAAGAAVALRALPVSVLTRPSAQPLGAPTIMLDGTIIVEPSEAVFARGGEAAVPYVTGGVSWEASLLPLLTANPQWLGERIRSADASILALYGFGKDDGQAAADFVTDFYETEADRHLARLHAHAGHSAYVYRFSYLPTSQRGVLRGVAHGVDVLYAFGWLPRTATDLLGTPIAAETPPDRAMSEAMIDRWAAFVKTGNPGGDWDAVSTSEDPVFEFGTEGPRLLPAFEPKRLDAIERLRGIAGWQPW